MTIVVVNPLPTITANNPSICQGQTASLTANGALAYAWQPGALTGSTITVSPQLTQVYTITGIDVNACSNTATASVTVSPIPTLSSNNQTICVGQSANLSISGANTYTWTPTATLNPNTGTPVTATATTTTTYSIIASSAAGCTQSTTVTVFVNGLPLVRVNSDTLCQGQSKVLSAGGAVQYVWVPGNLSGVSVTLNPQQTTSYTVTGTDANGCSNTATAYLFVKPMPVPAFSMDPAETDVYDPTISFFNTTINGITYHWSFGDKDTSILVNPKHTYKDSGHYVVCLTAYNQDCQAALCKNVVVKPDWTFYIPNAFSPNGDGLNDTFTGMGINIKSFEMWVFDRWGNLIYNCKDLTSPWIGSVNNKPGKENMAQEDVYVYKVRLKDVFGKEHIYIGGVSLVR